VTNPVIWAVFGAVFGSFFNVLIHRVPKNQSIVQPKSHCPHCGYELRVRDLIPVVSFLLLRGRCRQCGEPVSAQYPLVELTAAAIFAGVIALESNVASGVVGALFLSILLLCFVTDLQTRRIPNAFVVPGTAAGLILSAAGWSIPLRDALSGLLLALFLLMIIAVLSRGGMGMGDVKMMAMIGAYVGPMGVLVTLFAASLFGSIIGGAYLLKTKQGRKTPIPFGPFLAAAAAMEWIIRPLG